MVMKNKVLVIVAHPDDEVLGLGGTLIKHKKAGDDIYCLILANGCTSRDNVNKKEIELKEKCSNDCAKILGIKEIIKLRFKDNELDFYTLLEITKEIEKYIVRIKPDIIYTHHFGDVNIDHQIVYKSVMTACRPCNDNCPKKIYSFETLSSTEWQLNNNDLFKPNVFIDISKEIHEKIEALRCYDSEMRKYPHSRSYKGIMVLSQFRGMQSGFMKAEAFCLVREKI